MRYENYYFKAKHDEPAFLSGLSLPDPNAGPYDFVNCEFHPRLRETLENQYGTSTFKDCYR